MIPLQMVPQFACIDKGFVLHLVKIQSGFRSVKTKWMISAQTN